MPYHPRGFNWSPADQIDSYHGDLEREGAVFHRSSFGVSTRACEMGLLRRTTSIVRQPN
jgi:hypothetical protein